MRFISDLVGTFNSWFRINTVRLKDESGDLQVRDTDDAAYKGLHVEGLTLNEFSDAAELNKVLTVGENGKVVAETAGGGGGLDLEGPNQLVHLDGGDNPATAENTDVSEHGAVRSKPFELTADSGIVTVDFDRSNAFFIDLTGDITLADPTLTPRMVGQSGRIVFRQPPGDSHSLTADGVWRFPGGFSPQLTEEAGAVDMLVYEVISQTEVAAQLIPGLAPGTVPDPGIKIVPALEVGSMLFAEYTGSESGLSLGQIIPGDDLEAAGIDSAGSTITSGTVIPGDWQALGFAVGPVGGLATLWQRVS